MDEAVTAGSLTERLAAYWSEVAFDDLPKSAVDLAKRFLLDTLAAGIAGAHTAVAQSVIDASVRSLGGAAGGAVLWARGLALPPQQAALVNGTAAHALELDDFGGCGHSGAVVVPAVCALIGQRPVSGREMLVAVLAGYDLAARVLEGAGGYRPHNALGWHSTGTCGSFGAAAASARLLGFDRERFADALGIAGTFTGGIWSFLVDGAMTKRFHPGKAAETGVSAAYLAAAGMTGPHHVLDAPWGGFFSTYAPDIAEPELALAQLGQAFRIQRSGIKPYACCRTIHAPVDSLLLLLEEFSASHEEIAEVIVHGNQQTVLQFDRMRIDALLDAQFSMQYCLAVAALRKNLSLDQFQPLQTTDPQVRRLMQLIRLVPDRILGPTDYAAVEVVLADGRRGEKQVHVAKGHADNPLSAEEVEAKARSLMEPVLGRTATDGAMVLIADLETLPDIRALTSLLVPADGIRL